MLSVHGERGMVGTSKSVHYFLKCMELCIVRKKLGKCCDRELGAKSLPVA